MMMFRSTAVVLTLASMMALGNGQPATPAQRAGVATKPEYGTLHLQANLGSFRCIDGQGRFEATCAGTVLVNRLNGKINVSPGWRKEYEGNGRVIYTGRGTITVTGSWRGFQWFGRDLKAVWYGTGVVLVVGEFDRNLKTGDYWYDDPTKKNAWFNSSVTTVYLPQQQFGADTNAKPVERPKRGG